MGCKSKKKSQSTKFILLKNIFEKQILSMKYTKAIDLGKKLVF